MKSIGNTCGLNLAPVCVCHPPCSAIGVVLGNGMYNVPNPAPRYTKWVGSAGPRMLLAQLIVTLDDGSTFEVASAPGTQGGWSATDGGPVVFTHQYAGEDRNATLEVPGWVSGVCQLPLRYTSPPGHSTSMQDEPNFSPLSNPLVAWTPAQDCRPQAPAGELLPATFDPVRVMETLPALSVTPSSPPGTLLVDLGRNFAGYAEVHVAGVAPGSTVRVWPSETMVGGAIQQSSGGTPMYWQAFVAQGNASSDVVVRPTFSTYGWRWLAVQVLPPLPSALSPRAHAGGDDNGTITVLEATYGADCKTGLGGDETAAVAAWCGDNASSCTYTVCVCGDNPCGPRTPPCVTDPAQNCAKDFSVVWRCTLDPPGSNRSAYLPAEANGEALTINCLPPPPPPPEPNVTAVTGFFTRASAQRVGNFSCSNEWVNRIHNITAEAIAANLQSVLTDCPQCVRRWPLACLASLA